MNDFSEHYGEYWKYVVSSVDEEGWTYSKDVPHLLDYYFEANTHKEIDFQKNYQGQWRGYRWRPKSITEQLKV